MLVMNNRQLVPGSVARAPTLGIITEAWCRLAEQDPEEGVFAGLAQIQASQRLVPGECVEEAHHRHTRNLGPAGVWNPAV